MHPSIEENGFHGAVRAAEQAWAGTLVRCRIILESRTDGGAQGRMGGSQSKVHVCIEN